MSAAPFLDSDLPSGDAAQVASLDAVRERLVADARSWAVQLQECATLAWRAQRAGAQTRRTLALELAGSWHISQLTAERWIAEGERFCDALPRSLAMLGSGQLLRHQGSVLLHRTSGCTPEVARAVEAEVLPAGAELCPSDLGRQVTRVRLRIESEQADPAVAERADADRIAGRRTFARPTDDQMMLTGAVLTPEQGVAWATGMDQLERRERLADRAAGVERTAQQRRADLYAALPALVLAGTAADDRWRRAAGIPTGGRISPDPTEPLLLDDSLLDDGPVPPPWTFTSEQVCAQVVLNIHVPVSTVLELAKEPGTVDRYGPVSAEHIRLLRPHSLRRVMVDSLSGRPIAVDDKPTPVSHLRAQVQDMLRPAVVVDPDEPQHDPSTRLARLVDLRDVRCAGPGCSATRCDRDHLDRWPDGPTNARNLGLVSPRCHSAKHHGWTLQRHPDGSTTWTSPLKRRYHRPGPWQPPKPVDLYSDPPPPRPRPQPTPADDGDDDDDDSALLDGLTEAQPDAGQRRAGWDDEPPF